MLRSQCAVEESLKLIIFYSEFDNSLRMHIFAYIFVERSLNIKVEHCFENIVAFVQFFSGNVLKYLRCNVSHLRFSYL